MECLKLSDDFFVFQNLGLWCSHLVADEVQIAKISTCQMWLTTNSVPATIIVSLTLKDWMIKCECTLTHPLLVLLLDKVPGVGGQSTKVTTKHYSKIMLSSSLNWLPYIPITIFHNSASLIRGPWIRLDHKPIDHRLDHANSLSWLW